MRPLRPEVSGGQSRRRFLTQAAAALLGMAGRPLRSAAAKDTDAAAEGRALAAELIAAPPPFNTAGILRRRDSGGRWQRAIPVRLDVYEASPGWRSVYQVFEPGGALTETLVVHGAPDGGARYEYITVVPGSGLPRVRWLTGDEAALPFAGSDFWLADLGLEFLRWPEQRVLRNETRKGRLCRVLESRHPRPSPAFYARVLAWVDAEYRGLLRAEAFDTAGRLWKEFSIGSFKKIEGRWQLKSMEIRDERTDARTRLELDLEIPG